MNLFLLGPHREPTGNETFSSWRTSAQTLLGDAFTVIDPSKHRPKARDRAWIDWCRDQLDKTHLVLRFYPGPTSTEDMLHMYAYVATRAPILVFGMALDHRCTSLGILMHSTGRFDSLEKATKWVRQEMLGETPPGESKPLSMSVVRKNSNERSP